MTRDNEQDFLREAATPWFWHDCARSLVCSANRLQEWFVPVDRGEAPCDELELWYSSFAPMMLLYGLAAENLLKAIRIGQGVPATIGKALNPALRNHDLRRLADDAAIQLSVDERRLLERLRDFIESGKYPVGTRPARGLGAREFEEPADLDDTLALLTRLEDALYSTGKPVGPRCDLRALCRSAVGNPAGTR